MQFQSHQIFHVFVVAAAFVHYHGISEMAMHRLNIGECPPTTWAAVHPLPNPQTAPKPAEAKHFEYIHTFQLVGII